MFSDYEFYDNKTKYEDYYGDMDGGKGLIALFKALIFGP